MGYRRAFFLLLMAIVLVATVSPSFFMRSILVNAGNVTLNRAMSQPHPSFAVATQAYRQAQMYFKLVDGSSFANGTANPTGRPLAEPSAENFIHLGRLHDSWNELDTALHWYSLATEAGSPASDGWYYIGYLSNWRLPSPERDAPAALAALQQALEINDFSSETMKAETLYRMGAVQCNYLGQEPENCVLAYEQAIALDASHAFAYMELGRQRYRLNQELAPAERYIQQALVVGDSFARKWAYFHLGELYREAGRPALAEEQYQLALAIDPQFQQAAQALGTLHDK